MAKEQSPNVSKHLLDKAALIFLQHPDQIYTREEIQNQLGISKATFYRLISELSGHLALEESSEGNVKYYSLPKKKAKRAYMSLDFIVKVDDKERMALTLLLDSRSRFISQTLEGLRKKLDNAGLLSNGSVPVLERKGAPQKLGDVSEDFMYTLIRAAETRTEIVMKYKSPYSDEVKEHTLWPVGVYLSDGNLYLYAYNKGLQDYFELQGINDQPKASSYALSRIQRVNPNEDVHFTLPEDISMANALNDPFGIVTNDPKRARVHIYNTGKNEKQVFFEKEKEWPEGTALTDCEDGSLIIDLTFSSRYAFKCWALSLGPNCRVEAPEDLAEEIREELKAALALY